MKTILAYTDGSAVVNGKRKGHGGFGTYFPDLDGRIQGFSLGFKNTKVGRMEILALYYAIINMPLRSKEQVTLELYTDSEYVEKSFTDGRLERWIQAGWRNTSGQVKNQDYWKPLLRELNRRTYMTLDIRHIRSHQVEKEKDPIKKAELMKNPHIIGNMMADWLADYKRHEIQLESDLVIK